MSAPANHAAVVVWPRRIVAAAAVGFGLWTVCAHATVIGGGSGWRLFTTAAVAFAIAAVAAASWVRRVGQAQAAAWLDGVLAEPLPAPPAQSTWPGVGLPLALCVLCILGFWAFMKDAWWVWGGSLALLLASAIFILVRGRGERWRAEGPIESRRWQGPLLAVLSAASGYLAMCVSRSNTDDAYYVNIAVALMDDPSAPLFLRDTLHDTGALMMPAYRVHSYELLAGTLSWLSGVDALPMMHIGMTAVTGALLPLAWSALLQELDRERWFAMLLVVLGWYVLDGDDYFSPSMHAYGRLFQGKAVLCSVAVPIIAAYGLRFGRAPTAGRFALLALSTAGAVGLSSTGLWLGPAVAVTAVFSTMRLHPRFVAIALLGLLACCYPVAMGLWVRAQLAPSKSVAKNLVSGSVKAIDAVSFEPLQNALYVLFSGWPQAFLYCGALLLSFALARTALMRRYLLAFSLVFLLVLANPFLDQVVRQSLVGDSTFKRIGWFLPLGAALGHLFTMFWSARQSPQRRRAAIAVGLSMFVGFFGLAPEITLFEHADVRATPSLKVSGKGLAAARAVTAAMPERGHVLATVYVAMFLPLVQRHAYPVIIKPKWFRREHEGPRRFRLRRVVDREGKPMAGRRLAWFQRELEHFDVRGLVLTDKAMETERMAESLRELGFVERDHVPRFEIWTRPPTASAGGRRAR